MFLVGCQGKVNGLFAASKLWKNGQNAVGWFLEIVGSWLGFVG